MSSSTTNNSLKYTGVVTLSQYIGDKKVEIAKVHNAGAYPLFNFLSDCLLGDFELANLNRPTKIMLLSKVYDSANSNSFDYVSNSGFMSVTSKPEKVYDSNTSSKIRYSFIITRDKLEGTSFDCIALYPMSASMQDYKNFSAICDVRQKDMSTIASTMSLVVDWELTISNQ